MTLHFKNPTKNTSKFISTSHNTPVDTIIRQKTPLTLPSLLRINDDSPINILYQFFSTWKQITFFFPLHRNSNRATKCFDQQRRPHLVDWIFFYNPHNTYLPTNSPAGKVFYSFINEEDFLHIRTATYLKNSPV